MENNWLVTLVVIYLIGFILSQLTEVVLADVKSIKSPRKQQKHPPEDGRLINLLAQYLPVYDQTGKQTWWQFLQSGFIWLEPLAVIYLSYVAGRFEEARPLLICLSVVGFVLLNNIWKTKAFTVRKKLRLTLLLPAQIIPYYWVNLIYVLRDIYRIFARAIRAFTTGQINFPLQLRFPENHK